MNVTDLTRAIKTEAQSLGFDLAGVCEAGQPTGISRLDDWLAAGYAGEMDYLPARRDAYHHPQSVLDGVQSIVMLTMNYRTGEAVDPQPAQGKIAGYARHRDYHDVIHERLKSLVAVMDRLVPEERSRGVVDTAPLLERPFAQAAGLGWIGKNTLLLNREQGSWFFLAAMLTTARLECDAPHTADHCGTCRACLDACPTDAFPEPYVLDARRCISYLTIELRGPIPEDLRAGVGDWLFGCDICQDVCPWNHRAPQTSHDEFQPAAGTHPTDLIALFELDDPAFRHRFRDTPLWRPKRRGILRNAAIVLGNRPTPRAIGALVRGLSDAEPLVRGACAWALGKYTEPQAADALRARREIEEDADVKKEIEQAMGPGG